jgi:uncharacterized membrane protein
MGAAFVILFWWLLFAGTHLVLSSSAVRPHLIARLGERPFLGVYSLVAFATFIPLASSYARHKHAGPLLWRTFGPYLIARDLNLAFMVFAFVLLVLGLVARPPSSLMPSGGVPEAYGVTRITRHPTFAAIFLFGIAHCLVNGYLSDLVFFGGFPVFAWVGAAHQDARKVVDVPGYTEFKNTTSFVPFGAMFDGHQRLDLRELRWPIVLLAIVIFYIVRAHHPQLFGGVLMTL